MEHLEMIPIKRFRRQGEQDMEDIVIREVPLTIILDNQELVTLLCTPSDFKYLAVGFIFSEGLLSSADEIKKVTVDERRGVVRVESKEGKELPEGILFKRLISSGCGRGASFYTAADIQTLAEVSSTTVISVRQVFSLLREFQHRSQIFKDTGGVHSAALCDAEQILVFSEDVGRHNAIDKIFGECIMTGIPADGRIILTSGRISSEIALKAVKMKVPILISRSAPTTMGVQIANDLGLTLIGFARGERMNVYSHSQRIKNDSRQ